MASQDLSLQVARFLERLRLAEAPPSPEALNELAATIAAGFNATLGEVAILRLSPDGMLSFLTPIGLAKLGAIPVTNSHSLAVRTIREKRGEFINNFSTYRHPTVFEAVDLSAEQKAAPIQKIVSAPIVSDGKVLGVIQVSRKGKAGEPVGPDFRSQDLAELTAIGTILGKFLATLPSSPNPRKPAQA